jgi:hypothetical protein
MGVNAQTSVPAFTSGQVLTAQQQTEINTGVPVFATTVTRDAAFGGTGEKVLAQGQLAYIEATNIVQYYNGTSWATLGPADSGLTLVSSTTIGSAVATVTISNCFSSTYDNYYVIMSGGVADSTRNITLQLGTTATGYYQFTAYGAYNAATLTGEAAANATKWDYVGRGTTNSLMANFTLLAPNLAKNTHIVLTSSTSATTAQVFFSAGYLADTTQYTDMKFTIASGTATGGTIKVYGLKN